MINISNIGKQIMPVSFTGGTTVTPGITISLAPLVNTKAIFGYGIGGTPTSVRSITNLVSNTGVVATDTPGVGTVRYSLAAAGYSLS